MNIEINKPLDIKIAEVDQIANLLPAIVIIHQLSDMVLKYMSPLGIKMLNASEEEIINIPISEYIHQFFNPEDAVDYAPKIQHLIANGSKDEMISFFQQVRPSETDDFKWYLSTTKIFHFDAENQPSHIITFAHPIDPEHHLSSKVSRLLEENNYLKRNQQKLSSLTNREREIVRSMAIGETSDSIAQKLNIAEATVSTHRKNIKQKLDIHSNYDIVKFAQAFDLI